MPSCMIRDIPVHYEVQGEGRPLIAIHGWGVDHRLMKGCIEPCFKGNPGPWQRIYFDLPGMGRTPGRPWITGSDAMLDVVTDFIEHVLPGERFALAGESYGGYLSRGLVAQMAERIDGLFLLCPLADPETQFDHAPPLKVLQKGQALLDGLDPADREAFCFVAVRQTEDCWRRYRENVLPGLRCKDQTFLETCLGQHVPFTFAIDTPARPFEKPTLILAGRQDSMVGYKDQWAFLEAYPRASFVVLDKAGHALESEQPALLQALFGEWRARIEAEVA